MGGDLCNLHALTDKLDGENRLHGQTVANFVPYAQKFPALILVIMGGSWCMLSLTNGTVKIDFMERWFEKSRRGCEIFCFP